MLRSVQRGFAIGLTAASLLAGAAGCGGPQKPRPPAVAQPTYLMMGSDEAAAVTYLDEMSTILEAQVGDPAQALSRLVAYLATNRAQMLANARALESRFAAFRGRERRQYEVELARYLEAANVRWRTARSAIMSRDSATGRRIQEAVERLDQ